MVSHWDCQLQHSFHFNLFPLSPFMRSRQLSLGVPSKLLLLLFARISLNKNRPCFIPTWHSKCFHFSVHYLHASIYNTTIQWIYRPCSSFGRCSLNTWLVNLCKRNRKYDNTKWAHIYWSIEQLDTQAFLAVYWVPVTLTTLTCEINNLGLQLICKYR